MLEREAVLRRCTRFFGHPPKSARERLLDIAGAAAPDEYPDRYGGGELLASFEREIAALLGKEDAVFMPSGIMAQQIALRIHCEQRAAGNVALHPQSHLIVHENAAMELLHALRPVPVGDRHALFSVADLDAVADPLGALLLELPERNLGGALRAWDDVQALVDAAHARGAAAHLDGARLWETQPFYGRSLAELAAPFDSVYVSFYKILDGVAGAALAGSKDFAAQARGWQWRHGGRLVQQYPMIISARDGLRRFLPRIPLYWERARALGAVFAAFPGVRVTPDPPQTNMMHVFVPGDRARLEAAALRVSHESGVWMPAGWASTQVPGVHMFELSCAEGSLELSDDEVRELFGRLLAYAAEA